MCGETHRMATNEGKQTRMWKPKYVIYFKLPYWSPFCSEWRGSRRVDSKSFLFYLLSNLSSRETFCLKSFIYVQKIEKLKMMLLQRKRRWKGTITWPFFFFFPLWGLVISREQVAGAHLWYPRGRSLYRNQAQENVCLQTSPWTKSIWTVQFIFFTPCWSSLNS